MLTEPREELAEEVAEVSTTADLTVVIVNLGKVAANH
jgi:hypothetical protein